MNKKNIAALLVIMLMGLTPLFAQNSTVSSMAEILSRLNHYPTATDKDVLQRIVADESNAASERAVAQAMINLQHRASEADKAILAEIHNDNASPDELKILASILMRINHTPSDGDVKQLKTLMGQSR